MTKTYLTEQRFSDFKLLPELTTTLQKLGFDYCTPIQAATLPHALTGKDIAGQAQTGTGKTIAFLTATFNHLLQHPRDSTSNVTQPRALIIAPTRELVVQIHAEASKLAEPLAIKVALAYGGDGYDKQLQALTSGVDILVATTGRLIDYIKNHYINLEKLQVVVLDEADRMFDLGFIKDLRWLFRKMPPTTERMTLLYSATLSFRIRELAFEYMNEPQYIEIEPEQKTGQYIKEELFHVSNQDKMPLLQTLIEEEWPERSIIFANTKYSCELIANHLLADKLRVGLLTGDVIQKKRLKILDDFIDGKIDILVATDVAARGLHIPAVTHVFNYDLPDDCEDYVHRIGRTGRAGASGHAITLACEKYAVNLPNIESYIEHIIPVSQYNKEALLSDLPAALVSKPKHFRRNTNKRNKTTTKTHTVKI